MRHGLNKSTFHSIYIIAVSILSVSNAQAAEFTPLGTLPGETRSFAESISADGTAVVGSSGSSAFRWTIEAGMVDLGRPDGVNPTYGIEANGVSQFGSVVTGTWGFGSSPSIRQAFRWTAGTGVALLDSTFQGHGISADGTVIVGDGGQAYRWTEATGPVYLGILPGGSRFPETSIGEDVSADGNVVIGTSTIEGSSEGFERYGGFRWTAATGMIAIDHADTSPDPSSHALAVSADGTTIVGFSGPRSAAQSSDCEFGGWQAFRWTEATGAVGLGSLPTQATCGHSRAVGVSADGGVVVGNAFTSDPSSRLPFVWTETSGMRDLLDLLLLGGATGLEGWSDIVATDISDDGNVITGSGTNPQGNVEAWIATLDTSSLGRFNDVLPDHWAFRFISIIADQGITRGCGNDNFCPSAAVTRAEMAVFLERGMRGGDFRPPPATGNVFIDVPANHWAADFIEQLSSDGITSGCGNNNFCPDAEVTRDQMAVFLLRAKYGSGHLAPPANGVFDDVPLSYWVAHWIEQLAAEGITSGCGNNNYCPEDAVTRDQMAVFLVRTFGL